MALRETLVKGWWGLGLVFVPQAIYRYFENVRALGKIDAPSYRDPEVVTLSQYPFRVPVSPFKEPLPLIASGLALAIVGALLFGGSSSSNNYSAPSFYFGEVGSCYEEVTSADGNKIRMVECTNSGANLKSVAVVDSTLLCPSTSVYTTEASLPDGTSKTACLEYK
jgi:hypothetical protein